MSNHTTGAQRRNKRMDEIFERSKVLNEKYHGKDSFGSSKTKALSSSKILNKGHKALALIKNRNKEELEHSAAFDKRFGSFE